MSTTRLGNRIEEDVTGSSVPSSVTRFAYDGQNVWADLDGSNNLVMRRLFLNAVDSVTAQITASGTVAWYLTDRLGSVRVLTDASGAVIDRITYDGFGNIIAETNPSASDRYLWTGSQFDRVTGLQYSQAHYYDPTTGRWTTEDPMGFPAGDANLYRYVGNNPTNLTDPSGLNETEDKANALLNQISKGTQGILTALELIDLVKSKDKNVARNAQKALLAFLQKLQPAKAPSKDEVEKVGQYIFDLESDAFKVRQKATESLIAAGPQALMALECNLQGKNSLEFTTRLKFVIEQIKANEIRAEKFASELLRIFDGRFSGPQLYDADLRKMILAEFQRLAKGEPGSPLTTYADAIVQDWSKNANKKK